MGDLTFLPWARAGASAAVNATATAMGPNRPSISVRLTVTQTLDGGAPATLNPNPGVTMELLGPGDVTGLAPGQVIRTEPADGTIGVEPTVFPAVEFGDVTLPWLFTPAPENAPWPGAAPPPAGSYRLLPWICLVTVPAADGITLDAATGTLTIGTPADARLELPDLADAWAWAHVQYAGDLPADPAAAVTALAGTPGGGLSRLLSPRSLAPDTRYYACVVPTFMAGRVAGLGGSPDPQAAAGPAWDISANGEPELTLPVYYSFTFTTGVGGDFQSLAQLLVHPPQVTAGPDSGLGPRTLTVSLPFGQPPTSTVTLSMPGMLGPVVTDPPPPPPLPSAVEQAVQDAITPNPADALPELLATAYGAAQAQIRSVGFSSNWGALPSWFQALNTDPRLRVAAALGRQVVAAQREQLVAAAWAQAGQAQQANALLSRAQLARAATARQLARHLSPVDTLSFLRLTSPHASRVPLTAGAVTGSVWSVIRDTPGTDPRLAAVTTAAYRRLARPHGPHGRATAAPAPPAVPFTIGPNDPVFDPARTVPSRVFAERLSAAVTAAADPAGGPRGTSSGGTGTQPGADPMRGFAQQVSYPAGMFGPLAALAQEAILPGASTIPPNTALVLQPNPDLIVAYLVGLNTEIIRLLLWRGVPADPTATPFTYFWDQRGQGGGPPDITPIAGWDPKATLGSQLASQKAGGAQVFLAVRAELLRRYPTTAVYAAPAQPMTGTTGHTVNLTSVVQPTFTATLPPDLHLYGFPASALTISSATGVPGFFFVFQQQVTETRFGSDALKKAGVAGPAGAYWPVAALAGLPSPPAGQADAIANAIRMPPVLAAIHARALLLPSGG
jgi:hypothetical protein